MVFNLSEQNSVAHQFIGELRDANVQQDRARFRRNLERLGSIFAYEISKTLRYQDKEVETPLGISTVGQLADPLVLATVLRAGLPLHHGFLNFFEYAESAFISTFRSHHKDGSFEVRLQYITSPILDGKTVILTDPMLATGSSMEKAIQALLDHGAPKSLHIVTVIAANPGLSRIRRLFPKAHLWIGALDEELTAKSYIVPGLGDAGDLSYGNKKYD